MEYDDKILVEEVKKAVKVMKEGGIILYPTDTVWGIGCDATNATAVAKIYALKRREDSKSMLCLVDSMARVAQYVAEIPEIAYDLAELADKPITIIYPDAKGVAQNLIAEDGSLGMRVTSEKFSKYLCGALGKPVVSTSANISGQPAAACFPEISDEIKNGVDHIVDFRRSDREKKEPSSIIKLEKNGTFVLLRK
ncbi:MAG: threonylcarbamoyl-AMP synthase [Paludibacteraceae bacterium]|nr:threonylcarbamoyl-AMP synthase [Paludibacteraceae bacterium]